MEAVFQRVIYSFNKKNMIRILLIFLLTTQIADAQTTDTLKNASAWRNTYLQFGVQWYGTASNGDKLSFGFINHYDDWGRRQNIEVVRMNLTQLSTSYKTIPVISDVSELWSYCEDSLHNIYIGFNYARQFYKFNFRDSIYAENLGNPFFDTSRHALVYSYSLGTDNHIYLGSSSGGTFVSDYDPYTDSIRRFNLIDDWQDYVLTVQGNDSMIYAQVGQRSTVDYWAIQKSTGYQKKLFSLPSSTRFNVKTGVDNNCYVNFGSLTYKLNGFDTIRILPNWNNIKYKVATENLGLSGYFNASLSEFGFKNFNASFNGNIHINTAWTQNTIRFMFFDKTDTTGFYYVSDYYGTTYYYSSITNSYTPLGETGFNIYSAVQYDDSIFYFGNYPDGALLRWNKNQPWTLRKWVNGKVIDGYGATDNPHIECYFRSNTLAGFHHTLMLTIDSAGNVVGAGNVIRVGDGCSIAVWNPNTRTAYGYDWNKVSAGTNARDIIRYKNHILFSTNSPGGAKAGVYPRLYFYNSVTNQMDDSIDISNSLFAGGYGKMEIVDDTLIGSCGQMIYKIYLPTKTLLVTYSGIPTYNTYNFEHNFLALNTTATLPVGESYFLRFKYPTGYAFNECAYTTYNNYVLRFRNIYPPVSQQAIAQSLNFSISPNPASTIIRITGKGIFYLHDLQGKFLRKREDSGDIDITGLPAGIYFLNGQKVIKY